MLEITRADIDILVQLQKAETDTVQIESFLQDVEKEKDALGSKLTEFKAAHEKLERKFEAVRKACTDAELEMKMNDERIEKSSQTLKTLANHKAYAALQREVDDNKKRREPLENQYLQALEDKESLESRLKEHAGQLKQLSRKTVAEQKAVDKKSEADRARLQEYKDQRRSIGENLNPQLLKQFDEISETSGGVAVVEVKDQLCRGCFMNIPPQLYIEVQRCNSLILCPQCNRILYYNSEVE